MSLIRRVKNKTWFWIHLHRRNPFVARFCRLCKNIHRASEHPTYDVKINGECDVLAQVAPITQPVIFDVGANVGDWALMAQSVRPDAEIHCFEMSPSTASRLQANCAAFPHVRVNSLGLSNKEGEAFFYSYEGDASVLSSLRSRLYSHHSPVQKVARLTTGALYCSQNAISQIDFLKIDAEGHDYEVMEGFSKMLQKQTVRAIQFEHEGGRYLRDFYDLLQPLHYSIGRLYANYVDFRDYDHEMEHFLGPNYIALPVSNAELIASLKRGWK